MVPFHVTCEFYWIFGGTFSTRSNHVIILVVIVIFIMTYWYTLFIYPCYIFSQPCTKQLGACTGLDLLWRCLGSNLPSYKHLPQVFIFHGEKDHTLVESGSKHHLRSNQIQVIFTAKIWNHTLWHSMYGRFTCIWLVLRGKHTYSNLCMYTIYKYSY